MNRFVLSKLAPSWIELVPWTDKKNRLHKLRAAVFAGLLAPAVWLAARWLGHMLGPEPVNAAIHSTGYTAIWLLIGSLVITPLKAVSGQPTVAVIRRMTGNAALLYALLHLVLYVADQHWHLATVVMEILKRFYLTIGFVCLLGLVVLGVTSTDGWAQALGRRWKRLHRVVYGLTALGLVHYVLQSKLDVSQALLAAGVFGWLMLWRVLPAGRDRSWLPLLCITVGGALVTLVCEYLWYRFGTRINPLKVVFAETDISFGLHPAGEVILIGGIATGLVALRQVSDTAFGKRPYFTMLVYGLGAFAYDAAALLMGWSVTDDMPDEMRAPSTDLIWLVALGILGFVRWKLRDRPLRHLVDAVWVVCVLDNVLVVGSGSRTAVAAVLAVIVGFAILLGHRMWSSSRKSALTLIPLGLLLGFEAASII